MTQTFNLPVLLTLDNYQHESFPLLSIEEMIRADSYLKLIEKAC